MTIPFSGPGVYVTVGGYLVELNEYAIGTKETSPGLFKGKTVDKYNALSGWAWTSDGVVNIDDPWSAKLGLSQKLHFLSIPVPPQGYRYKDGYPQLVKIPAGQECMTPQGMLVKFTFDTDGEYIPVEKIEPEYYECDNPDPSYVVRKGDQFFWANEWNDTDKCVGMTIEKAFKPILKMRSLSPFPTKKPSIVNGAGFYLTKAGYVVELDGIRFAKNKIPGVAGTFAWNVDGSIDGYGMSSEWINKLQIVAKTGFSELPVLPNGYKWADGYPQFRTPKKGEWFFLAGFSHPVKAETDKDTRHFIVEQEEVWYTVTNPDYVLTEGDQYQHVDDGERWYSIINSIGKTPQQAKLNSSLWRCRSKNKEACLSSAPKETPDINFNLEKATDLTATLVKPSLFKRSFNYWVIEPASNAFRYVVITAVLWGGVEIYKNPAVVWKVLPKISVSINK
jgi:hypothetical protein